MSDFPKGGDISSTRTWLDRKGFIGIFNNWEADAIFGLSEEKIMAKVPGERGEMLWGLLNTARQTTANTLILLFKTLTSYGPAGSLAGLPFQVTLAPPAVQPQPVGTPVEFTHQPMYTDNASTYVVNNVKWFGLTGGSVQLYMRMEARRLWESLANKSNKPFVGFVQGCPGVGKSVVVFAFAVSHCLAHGKSLLFYNHHSGTDKMFSMDCRGRVTSIEFNSESHRSVLRSMRESHDMTVIDGMHDKTLLDGVFHNFPDTKTLIICTSYQAFHLNQEAATYFINVLNGVSLTVASWTISDYLDAINAECLLTDMTGSKKKKQREAERRFLVAGGSVHLFLLGVDHATDRLLASIRSVANYVDLYKGQVGDSSNIAVNSLMALYRDTRNARDIHMKSVPVSKFVLLELAQKCATMESAFQFIALARQALPDNPSWQGWVTKVEVLKIMKVRQQLDVYWNEDGKTLTTNFRCAAFQQMSADDTYPKCEKGVFGSMYVPYLWNQPLWDAVYYRPKKVLSVWQITSAESHTHKFKYLKELVKSTKASRVQFLTICPKDVYSHHHGKNSGKKEVAKKLGIKIETKVVWYENPSEAADSFGERESVCGVAGGDAPSAKRRRTS